MIILGIVLLIVGAVLYYNGVEINNDMDAQMESFFNDGVTNPGSTFEMMGIFLVICGILLIIVGVVRKVNENRGDNDIPQRKNSEISLTEKDSPRHKKTCAYCGADLLDESIFCSHCGRENSNFISCPNCSQRITADSLFCDFCGAELLLYKFSLQNSSIEDVLRVAFKCLKSEEFDDAQDLFDSVEKKDPQNVMVHLGKLLTDYRLHNLEELADVKEDFSKNIHFCEIMESDYDDVKSRVSVCHTYSQACIAMAYENYHIAMELFEELGEWKDSKEKKEHCQFKINHKNEKAKRKKLITLMVFIILVAAILVGILCKTVVIPTTKYNKASTLLQGENYVEAYDILTSIQGFKDVDEILEHFKALPQKELMTNGYGIQYHKDYSYDAVGNMVSKRVYGENSLSTVDNVENYSYNEKNDIIEKITSDIDSHKTRCEYEYKYDDAGVRLKEKETWDYGSWAEREHEYNTQGQLIKTIERGASRTDGSPYTEMTECIYNSAGIYCKKIVDWYSNDGTLTEHTEYIYDDLGLCTKKTRNYYGEVSFGGGKGGTNPIYTTDYYYDEKGNCIRESAKREYIDNEDWKSDSFTTTYTFEYNKKGELVKKTEITPEDGTITYEYSDFKIIYTEE